MPRDNWKRFINYERATVVCLGIGIGFFFDILNQRLLNSMIINDILSYMPWLSIGIYLGFILCKHEYMHALRLNYLRHINEEMFNTTLDVNKEDNSHWKRFWNYEKAVLAFLAIGFLSEPINKELLNASIPTAITAFLFWLSLGLYLGFILCKHEYHRALKLQHSQPLENESNETTLL